MSRQFNDYYISSGQYLVDEPHEWICCGGDYYVCKEGYVARKEKVLKPHNGDRQGHLNVRLRIDGEVHEEYIHRLVAKTFIPNNCGYPIVRHLDDDKENNHVDNLAWGTQKDNMDDMRRNGNAYIFTNEDREKHLRSMRKPVEAVDEKGNVTVFSSQTEAAKVLGLCQSNVGKVLSGQRKQTGGYIFRFARKEV